jgi:hypothetical protein
MNGSNQDTLRQLFHRGLSLLSDEATVQEWKDLAWELNKAIRGHTAALNAAAEAKAIEALPDAEKARRNERTKIDLGF